MAYDITARLNVVLNQGDLTRITKQLNQITSPTSNKQIGISIDTSGLASANRQITEAKNNMVSFGEQSGLAARRFGAFTLAAGGLIQISQGFKNMLSEAVAFDREMVRLKQVSSDAAGSGVSAIRKEIDKLSTGLGVSSSQLARVSVVLKQANLSLGETKSALEALALSALAPNFESMEKTAEGAIAIMKQFKIPAEELASALGAVNAVAGEFAVEASDLISVIQRTGGAFKAAGGSLNELLALFTSVRQTTRESAESIATGLRTIFTRLQRTGTADALKEIGVNLRYTREEALALNNVNLTNQFVGAYEAVSRLSAALNEIPATDPKFARLVEEIGGYRQISKVIPLIQEFSVSQQALNVAIAGGSSLMNSAQAAQGSFGNRLDKIAESYLSFGRSLSETSSFKTMFTMFEMAAKSGLILLEVLKPLLPMLTTIATMSMAKNMGSFGAGFATTFSGKPAKKSEGGPIGFKNGGIVPGHGSGDIVPAMLEPGERVIPKRFAYAGSVHENVDTSKIKGRKKFEEEFKDSKYRDLETGEHKIGFHGTQSDFDIFQNTKVKRGAYGKGFYHTAHREVAESYSGLARGKEGAKVMSNALNMKNPFNWNYGKNGDIDALMSNSKFAQDENGQITRKSWNAAASKTRFPEELSNPTFKNVNKILGRSPKLRETWWTKMHPSDRAPLVAHAFTKSLKKKGYDSIDVDFGMEKEKDSRVSVVFKSNQIKSLSGNDGSWDSKSPNINKALGGAIQRQRFALAGKVERAVLETGTNVKRTTTDPQDFKKGNIVNDSDNILYTISKTLFNDPASAGEKDIRLKGLKFEQAFAKKFNVLKTSGNYPVDFIVGDTPHELKNTQDNVSEPELLSKLLRHRKLSNSKFFSNSGSGGEDINAGELKVVYNSSNLNETQKADYKTISKEDIKKDKLNFQNRLHSESKDVSDQAYLDKFNTDLSAFGNAKTREATRSRYQLLRKDNRTATKKERRIMSIQDRLGPKDPLLFAGGGFIVPGVGNTDSVPMDLASGSYVIRKSSTEKLGFAKGGNVPALLTPGEAVFSPQSAAKIGSASLERMNKFGKFAAGGRIGFLKGGNTGKGSSPFYGSAGQDPADMQLTGETEKIAAELARLAMLSGKSNDYLKAFNEALKEVESATNDFAKAQRIKAQLDADPNNVTLLNSSTAANAQIQKSAEEINIKREQNAGTMDHVSGQLYGKTSEYLNSLRINPNDALSGSGLPGTNMGISLGSASGDIAQVKIASEESRIKSELIKKIEQQIFTIDSSISSEGAAEMANKEYARIRSGQSKVLTDDKGKIIGTSGYGDVLSGMGKDPAGESKKSSAIKNFLGFGSAGAGASPEEKAAQKQSNMMQRTMLMGGASSYGMEFLNSQLSKNTGKDAVDAVERKTEGSFAAGQGVSGGATGAMTGGLVAASLGLSGPLIGLTAVAIGVYSAFNALKEAAIALAKVEQENQETKTKDFLKNTIGGKEKGNSLELNQNLSDLRTAIFKTAKAESGMFDSNRDVDSKANKNLEKFLAENNPQIAKSASMGIKEEIIGAGNIKDVEKFVQELIKATPAIQENISMSRKAGETLAEATEKIKNDAIRMAKAANNAEPMKKFNEELRAQSMALKTFADAINVALVRMTFLSSSFDHLSEVLDNPIRSIGMSGLNKNAQIISSPEGFSKEEFTTALEATFGQFGQFGQQSIEQFKPLSQIGALLPNFVAQAGANKDPSTKLEELLRGSFPAGNTNVDKIIAGIVTRANANDNFGADANQDPSKLAEELLAPFMVPLAKYGKLINSLQSEFANKFSASLVKLSSSMIKYFSDIEKKASMQNDLSKMQRQGLNLLETGADQNVADPQRALNLFEQSQNRLLSQARGGANVKGDIGSIKNGLITSIEAQSAAQVKMDRAKGSKESNEATIEFARAGMDIHIFRTALQNFVDKSGELISEFNNQIGELLSKRGAGIEAIKKYAMSDPQSKMQFNQGQNLFKMLDSGRMNPAMAVNNPEILKSMYSFADSMGDFKVFKDSQGNDVTAKQSLDTQLFLPILKQMRPDLGDDKLQNMISGRNSVQERAIDAQSALNDVSLKLIDAINVNLINSQKELTTQLATLNAQMALNVEQQAQIQMMRQKGELEKIEKQSKESGLEGLNLNNDQQKDFIGMTKDPAFLKYLENQQKLANTQDIKFDEVALGEATSGNLERIRLEEGDAGLSPEADRRNALIDRADEIDKIFGGRVKGNTGFNQAEREVEAISKFTGFDEKKSREIRTQSLDKENDGSIGMALLRDAVKTEKDKKFINPLKKEQQDFYDKHLAKNIKTLQIGSAVESANSLQKLGLTAGGVAAALGQLAVNLNAANLAVIAQQQLLGIKPPPPAGGAVMRSGGGFISAQGLASGGPVYRREGGNSGDNIPAMLTAGEFVMNKGSVSKYGKKFMSDLNGGNISARQNEGGVQGLEEGGAPKTPWKDKGISYTSPQTSHATIGENLSAGFNQIGQFAQQTGQETVSLAPHVPLALSNVAASSMNSLVGVKKYVEIIDNSHPPVEDTSRFTKASEFKDAHTKITTFYKVQAYQNWKNANEAGALVNAPSMWRQSPFGFLGLRGERLERERIAKVANDYKEFGEEYHNNRYLNLIENTTRDRGIFAGHKRLTKEENPNFQAEQTEQAQEAARNTPQGLAAAEREQAQEAARNTPQGLAAAERERIRLANQGAAELRAKKEKESLDDGRKQIRLANEDAEGRIRPAKKPILPEPPPPTPEQMAQFGRDRLAQEERDREASNARRAELDKKDIEAGRKPSPDRQETIRHKIRNEFNWSHLKNYLLRVPMKYTNNGMSDISEYDLFAAISVRDLWQDYVKSQEGNSLMGIRQPEWKNLSGNDGETISKELKRSASDGAPKIGAIFNSDFDNKINLDETFSFMKRNKIMVEQFLDSYYGEEKITDGGAKIFKKLSYSEKSNDILNNIERALGVAAYPELFREKYYDKSTAQHFSKIGLMDAMSKAARKLAPDDPIFKVDDLQKEIDLLTLLHPNGTPENIRTQAERNLVRRRRKPNAQDDNKPKPDNGEKKINANKSNRNLNRAKLQKELLRFSELRQLEFSMMPAYGKALDEDPTMLKFMKDFKEPTTAKNFDEKQKMQGFFIAMHYNSLAAIKRNEKFPFGQDKAEELSKSGLISPYTNNRALMRLNNLYFSNVPTYNPNKLLEFIPSFIQKRKDAIAKGNDHGEMQWAPPKTVQEIIDSILKLNKGGIVPKGFASGGHVEDISSSYKESARLKGFTPRGTDTVPAMLSAGEFVIKQSSVAKYGADTLGAINNGTMKLASGGPVGSVGVSGGSGGSSVDMTPFMESSRKLTDAINALSGGFGSFTESVGSFNASVGQFGEFANIFAQGAAMIPQTILMQTENQVLVDMMNMAPAANAIASSLMPLIQQEMVNTINMMNMNNPSYIAQNSGGA